jgi:ethanolamine transporter EutH
MRCMKEEDDPTRTWIAIGRGLAAVSVLSIAGGMIMVFGDTGVSLRDRAFQACESASAFAGLFALAAVVVLLLSNTPTERSRGVLVIAQCIGVVMVTCAVYAAWYSLTKTSRLPGPDQNTSFVAFVGLNWAYRLSGLLMAVAAAVVGALTIFAAGRARTRMPQTVTQDHPSGHA